MTCLHLQKTWTAEEGEEIAIDRFPFIIGRSEDTDHRLTFPFVSRRHCRFFLRDGQVWVQDLESYNGTFLNGERVNSPRPVEDGDELGLCHLTYRLSIEQTDR